MSRLIKTPEQLLTFVDSLLLPLSGITVLVPVSAVSEAIKCTMHSVAQTSKNWLVGGVEWQETKIPLISLEAMFDNSQVKLKDTVHCSIIKKAGEGGEDQFYAIATQGYPRSIRITPTSDFQVQAGSDANVGVLMHARFEDLPVIMPDLEKIEQLLLEVV